MDHLKTKYLIIGAGISGLTFANYMEKDNEDYLILESEKEVGGYCKTIKRNGYVWDYAGHFFHFKTVQFKQKLLDNICEKDIVYKNKCTKIMYKNKLIDFPFQMNIHQLNKKDFIDCLYDLFNRPEKEQYENFLDMLYGKFGISIVEKFLKPYNEKLYACNLTELDINAMGRFFPYANIKEIINNMKEYNYNSYNSSFLYPKNGAGAFIKVLHDGLDKNRILLNCRAIKIDEENKFVETNNGKRIFYKFLINTTPLNKFLLTLNKKEFHNLSLKLSYNKVLVFNLGFDKKSKFVHEHWIYISDETINFYRVGFYDNILNNNKLSLYIEIGYEKNEKINLEKELDATLLNLKKLGIIDNTMVLKDYMSLIMDPAYVHINTKTEEKILKLKKDLKKLQIYSIGRYGGWTYCSMEDCMIEAFELYTILKE